MAGLINFNPLPPHGGRRTPAQADTTKIHFNPLPPHGGRLLRALFQRPPDNFNPLPPHGGRLYRSSHHRINRCISIHSLRMEGDGFWTEVFLNEEISIHSLRMEGDRAITYIVSAVFAFQSTPSAWRETVYHLHPLYVNSLFQSTPSAWRETQNDSENSQYQYISIHSLRMEGDPPSELGTNIKPVISIHSLRMEGDQGGRMLNGFYQSFQSTPSAWRETFYKRSAVRYSVNFNPLPPHGGRQ